jgi:Protein of unknown function (DUF3626)
MGITIAFDPDQRLADGRPLAQALNGDGVYPRTAGSGKCHLRLRPHVQAHGDVVLSRDVEAIVIDSAYLGTHTGVTLQATAERFGTAAEWADGYAGGQEIGGLPISQ